MNKFNVRFGRVVEMFFLIPQTMVIVWKIMLTAVLRYAINFNQYSYGDKARAYESRLPG